MTKEQVISLRKEFHHLSQPDRDQVERDRNGNETGNITINVPLVVRVNTSYLLDEMTSCIIWDDDKEIIWKKTNEYGGIETNNEPAGPLNYICPMYVRA